MSTCLHHLKDGPFFFNFHGLFRRCGFQILFVSFIWTFWQPALGLSLPPPSPGDFSWTQSLKDSERFWERPEKQNAMNEKRMVLVSTTQESKEQWRFKGAAHVVAPGEFCFLNLKDFNRLKRMSEHFSKVFWNEKTAQLELEIHFLGMTRALQIELFESAAESSDRTRKIYFRSLGPFVKGAEGVLFIKDLERQAAELSLISHFHGSVRWVPDFIFVLASEAVMHHVALSLRNQLETDYKLSLH